MKKIKLDSDTKMILSLLLVGTGIMIVLTYYVKKKMLKDTYEYYKRENENKK